MRAVAFSLSPLRPSFAYALKMVAIPEFPDMPLLPVGGSGKDLLKPHHIPFSQLIPFAGIGRFRHGKKSNRLPEASGTSWGG